VNTALAGVPQVGDHEPRLTTWYAVGQSLAIASIFFLQPGTWPYSVWQMLVGWAAAAAVFTGLRRHRPEGALAWYLFGAGVFLSTTGSMVENVLRRTFHEVSSPSVADFFWLAQYPAFLVGLAVLLYRQSATQELESLLLSTAICAGVTVMMGLFAWDFLVWRADTDHNLSIVTRMVNTAYPLADLMAISLLLRLCVGGGPRSAAFGLALLSQCFLLAADTGWMIVTRKGIDPGPVLERLMNMSSLTGYALIGGASLTSAVRTIAASPGHRKLSPIGWMTFAVSLLTGPLVLLAQAMIDSWHHLWGA
jgi:hypothetical protein